MSASGEGQPAQSPATARLTRSEWALLLILVAIQFTHMVDFVIIMPLGDRFRKELGVTPDQFGLIVASYAWAAAVASLAASFVMDRFDRKRVLLVMYGGFAVSTLVCGLAPTYEWLLVARTLAGVFGGVAAVALMSVIGDVFPPAKRGRATGAVISAFAVASIVGLPLGLEIADRFGRNLPFTVLAGLSAVVWLVGLVRLPRVRGHLGVARRHPWAEFLAVVREPNHRRGFAFSFFLVLGTFTVASFLAPVLCSENGWDEKQLKFIYCFGGVCTLLTTTLVGRLADRVPRLPLFRVLGGGALVMAVVVSAVPLGTVLGASVALGAFMALAAGRMVPAQAMILGAAAPAVRGAFMSLNTFVQHVATGLAPMVAGWLITESPEDKKLHGFPLVGLVSAAAAAVSLVLAGGLKPVPQHLPTPVPPLVPPEEGLPVAEPEAVTV
jgi:predicted MFS family arabinose efflux permease